MNARWATVAAVLPTLILAGCGGTAHRQPVGDLIPGRRLTVYVSVPLDGASAAAGRAVMDGATLAVNAVDGRIGRYRIMIKVVDDATEATGQWSASAATLAAQTAVADRTTAGYIGDFDSGASAISIPILNRLAIPQVSPTSTAVGLDDDGLGSSPGEPYAYYPTSLRTFARVVPSDEVQAQVQVTLQRSEGCRSVYVLDDGEYDGAQSSAAFIEVAQSRHYPVIASQSYVPAEASYSSVGQTVAQSGADCVLVAAIPARSAAQLTEQVADQARKVRIFAMAGLAQPSFFDPHQGGIPSSLDSRVLITAAGDPSPGGSGRVNRAVRAFDLAYAVHYGTPLPAAADGFAASQLLLSAIRRATDDGRRPALRTKIVDALMRSRRRVSPLGVFSIERDGDTTLRDYGVYRIVDGQLRLVRTLSG